MHHPTAFTSVVEHWHGCNDNNDDLDESNVDYFDYDDDDGGVLKITCKLCCSLNGYSHDSDSFG